MFVDASALVAVLTEEAGSTALASEMEATEGAVTSPIAFFETVAAVARKSRLSPEIVSREVQAFLERSSIPVSPLTKEAGMLAVEAFERYGKASGHPARLNLADCFAYAMARQQGVRLLYKGEDFARTDLA